VIGGDDLLTEKKTPYWGAYYGVLTKTIGFRSGEHWLSQPDGIFIKAIAGYLIKDLSEVSVTRLLFAKN